MVKQWVYTHTPMVTEWQIGYMSKHEDYGALFASVSGKYEDETVDLS